MSNAGDNLADTDHLLELVRSGNPTAMENLLARYRAFMRGVVAARLDPRLLRGGAASDAVQEAQLEVLRRLPDYLRNPRMPFRPWVQWIARQHAIRAWRKEGRQVEINEQMSESGDQPPARDPTPSEAMHTRELGPLVRAALNQLKPEDREVLQLLFFEGCSVQEAARRLGIRPDAASQRRHRALNRLTDQLRNLAPEILAP
jgi:RNA polymerase sigma-70 factor (ECF subfamily)